jgi:2-polyprenyl-6-methoxyphenol hydroxylase-like FAD-dependent oxidoreductase
MTGDVESADVVIAGAGPTGLMLAIELCLGGVTPVVLERLPEISEIPKGNGLIGHIVTVLDYRGLLDPLRADSTYTGPVPSFFFGPLKVDFSALGTSPLHVLALQQRQLERKLADRLAELGGTLRRDHEVTGLAPADDAVTVEVRGPAGPYQIRARYVVGCDGAHSSVRKLAGIDFPGLTSGSVSRIGRVRVPARLIVKGTRELDVPGAGRLQVMQPVRTARGTYALGPQASVDKAAPPDAYIVSTIEDDPAADLTAPMTLDELRDSVRRVLGADLPMSDPVWLTRVVGNSRQADRYRDGRILLAGDAAHVFGLGGSLNTGLLDVINLGWKLAAEARGSAPNGLLDSYHTERHAAGQRALLLSRAQSGLLRDDEYSRATRELVGELLAFPEPMRHLGEAMAGSDVRYDMAARGEATLAGGRHALVGRLAPDLRVKTADGPVRIAVLMRQARPVLLDFTADGRVAAAAASFDGPVTTLITQPLTGAAPADGLLIRPDGYVAWATGPAAADPVAGLAAALRTWCPSAGYGAGGSGFGSAPPYRRSRLAKISQACQRWRRSKSGNSVSRNTISA